MSGLHGGLGRGSHGRGKRGDLGADCRWVLTFDSTGSGQTNTACSTAACMRVEAAAPVSQRMVCKQQARLTSLGASRVCRVPWMRCMCSNVQQPDVHMCLAHMLPGAT